MPGTHFLWQRIFMILITEALNQITTRAEFHAYVDYMIDLPQTGANIWKERNHYHFKLNWFVNTLINLVKRKTEGTSSSDKNKISKSNFYHSCKFADKKVDCCKVIFKLANLKELDQLLTILISLSVPLITYSILINYLKLLSSE